MGKSPSPPAAQTVTQKTEIDPIQKSFLFGTPLPADYKQALEARNRQVVGPGSVNELSGDLNTLEGRLAAGMLVEADRNRFGIGTPNFSNRPTYRDPVTNQLYREGYGGDLTPFTPEPPQRGMKDGGLIALANGGMVPPTMGGRMPNLSNRETAYLMGLQALQGAAQPRMGYAVGGYVEGPGTGRSDSIPATIYQNGQPVQEAALSDGEFVMTERAVRGAGNGDREAGAARMYEMMRRFENGGRTS